MKEYELHLLAAAGTILGTVALAAPAIWLGGGSGDAHAGPDLSQFEVIEADLAMKSEEAPKTPQKVTRTPDPKVDEAVGGDPNAKAETCQKDADCGPGKQCRNSLCVRKETKHPDDPIDLSQYQHNTDDDADVGDTKQYKPGAFDGDEQGWAPTTKGDKFYIELNKDLRAGWEYPEILSDEGFPAGCIHLEADGKIPEVKMLEKSGNVELDDSVERALAALQKLRNQDPVEVPTHLLQTGVTEKWLCFRFKPKAS